MTQAPREPLRLYPIIAAAILAACSAVLVWVISFGSHRFIPIWVAAQAYLVIAVLMAFRHWPPMGRWLGRMPVPHRVVFALIVGGMIAGHFSLHARTYFPFVAWEIFPFKDERDPVTCREFIATTASGKKVRLLVEQLFPSIVQIYPLETLDDPKLYPPGTTDHLAHALAKVYNDRHAGDPVQQIDLVLLAVQLHPPANESRAQPSCELLKRYDISSDRWN